MGWPFRYSHVKSTNRGFKSCSQGGMIDHTPSGLSNPLNLQVIHFRFLSTRTECPLSKSSQGEAKRSRDQQIARRSMSSHETISPDEYLQMKAKIALYEETQNTATNTSRSNCSPTSPCAVPCNVSHNSMGITPANCPVVAAVNATATSMASTLSSQSGHNASSKELENDINNSLMLLDEKIEKLQRKNDKRFRIALYWICGLTVVMISVSVVTIPYVLDNMPITDSTTML